MRDAASRDKRVMAALEAIGIPLTIEAYCNEWQRQFGADILMFNAEPEPEPASVPRPIPVRMIEIKAVNRRLGDLLPPGDFAVPLNPQRVSAPSDSDRRRRPRTVSSGDRLAVCRELISHGHVPSDEDIEAIMRGDE